MYIDDEILIKQYIEQEQPATDFNLQDRISLDIVEDTDIIVTFDPLLVTQQNFGILANLPKIIQDSGEVGEFELEIFNIKINKIQTYEKELIKCNIS